MKTESLEEIWQWNLMFIRLRAKMPKVDESRLNEGKAMPVSISTQAFPEAKASCAIRVY